MSYQVVDWVMQQYVRDPRHKLVLMVIATHADKTGQCYPRVRTIARKASMSPRTVHRVLAELSQHHFDLITWKRQPGTSNLYRLHCPSFGGKESAVAEPCAITTTDPARLNRVADPPLPLSGRTKNHHFNHHNQKHTDLNPVLRARGLPRRTSSEIDVSLATKVGPTVGDGIEILSSIPLSELDQLRAQERVGTLTELDIELVRTKWRADDWKRAREALMPRAPTRKDGSNE